MPTAAEWPPLIPSMTNLPITDPRCINESCTAFYAALNANQAAIAYASLGEHAHWMIWYFVAVTGVFTLVHGYHLYNDRVGLTGIRRSQTSIPQKALALLRYITYCRINNPFLNRLGLPLNGMLIFLLSSVMLIAALTFGVRPYYRENYGSVRKDLVYHDVS